MPMTREEVLCAYRFLLNRDPENEAAIDWHRSAAGWIELRQAIMGSAEYRHIHGYLDKWMVAPIFEDTMLLWVNMRDKYVSIHCVEDAYEPENSEIIRKLLRPGDTFLDVGANIGWFTVLGGSIVGPKGRVHSFEPQPVIAGYLGRTIQLNGLGGYVTLHQAGVWNEPGEMALAWEEDAENQGASHLQPAVDNPETGSKVELATIDSLRLDRCDLIKIDVEGAEPKAMEGAEQLLRRARPLILSELHSAQLPVVSGATCESYVGEMKARGYTCLGLRDGFAGRVLSPSEPWGDGFTDVLFVPEEKLQPTIAALSADAPPVQHASREEPESSSRRPSFLERIGIRARR